MQHWLICLIMNFEKSASNLLKTTVLIIRMFRVDFVFMATGFVELANFGKKVEAGRGKRYFIYSNISADDDDIEDVEYSGRWKELVRFEKGFVFVALFEKINSNE